MSEVLINHARACALSGHRVVDKNLDRNKLKELFIKLIGEGFNTFLIGMALGFDTLCFNLLYELKSDYDIKLIACIPCVNQDAKFNMSQKKEYDKMLKLADEKVYIEESYSPTCMQKRNEYLVDNSSLLVAYLRRNYGGTYQTINYAIKKDIQIIKV